MVTLPDKPKSLGVQVKACNLRWPKRLAEAFAVEDVSPGRFQPTSNVHAFVVEKRYARLYRHERAGLWAESSLRTISEWVQKYELAGASLGQFAFLDTETLGLAGGIGIDTFLIGVEWFEGPQFPLVQFFLREPDEEPAQLITFTEYLEPYKVLMTFNSIAFEALLLNTRLLINGQELLVHR